MVSSIPPDPYLELNREEIFYRILNKEVLNQAFSTIQLDKIEKTDNVHGEFGYFYDWLQYRSTISSWIADHPTEVKQISNSLKHGTYITTSDDDVYQHVQLHLIKNIDSVVDNQNEYTQIALSERLANAGYLPMFGFPTQVRVLYEKKPSRLPPQNVVDRNLDMAISEFAPGSEIVKDKKILTPVGIVHYHYVNNQVEETDGRGLLPNGISRCTNCNTVFLEVPENDTCTICQQSP